MEADAHNATREADCPDVLLLAALNAKDVRFWRLPAISGASVVVLRDDRDRLQAENAKLRALLGEVRALPGDDDGKSIAIALPREMVGRIDAAIGGYDPDLTEAPL